MQKPNLATQFSNQIVYVILNTEIQSGDECKKNNFRIQLGKKQSRGNSLGKQTRGPNEETKSGGLFGGGAGLGGVDRSGLLVGELGRRTFLAGRVGGLGGGGGVVEPGGERARGFSFGGAWWRVAFLVLPLRCPEVRGFARVCCWWVGGAGVVLLRAGGERAMGGSVGVG